MDEKIRKFMRGRYGVDELYKFHFMLYICFLIVGIFWKNSVILLIELGLIGLMIYRSMSKNVYKRRRENQRYLEIKNKGLKPLKNIKRNMNEFDSFVYRKCHKCKTTLKLPLPNKRGFQHARCPKCENKVTIFTLRKQKIEVITDKKKKKFRRNYNV